MIAFATFIALFLACLYGDWMWIPFWICLTAAVTIELLEPRRR
jgi:hypothetical protein